MWRRTNEEQRAASHAIAAPNRNALDAPDVLGVRTHARKKIATDGQQMKEEDVLLYFGIIDCLKVASKTKEAKFHRCACHCHVICQTI